MYNKSVESSVDNQFVQSPILKTAIGQISSDDKWDLSGSVKLREKQKTISMINHNSKVMLTDLCQS